MIQSTDPLELSSLWFDSIQVGLDVLAQHQLTLSDNESLPQPTREALQTWAHHTAETLPLEDVLMRLSLLDGRERPFQTPVQALALSWALMAHLSHSDTAFPSMSPQAVCEGDWGARLTQNWLNLLQQDDVLEEGTIGLRAWAVDMACEGFLHVSLLTKKQREMQASVLSRAQCENWERWLRTQCLPAEAFLAQASRTFWVWPDGALAHLEMGLQAWVDSGARPWANASEAGSEALQDCARISEWTLENETASNSKLWRHERAALTLRLLDWGADPLALSAAGIHALGAWCNAMDASGWDEHWPDIIARMARLGDPNTPDAQGNRPLVQLTGLQDNKENVLPSWSPWTMVDGDQLLRWGLSMAQALIEAGANPSPRLGRGGRLASTPELHPTWAAFLLAHIQQRALKSTLAAKKRKRTVVFDPRPAGVERRATSRTPGGHGEGEEGQEEPDRRGRGKQGEGRAKRL